MAKVRRDSQKHLDPGQWLNGSRVDPSGGEHADVFARWVKKEPEEALQWWINQDYQNAQFDSEVRSQLQLMLDASPRSTADFLLSLPETKRNRALSDRDVLEPLIGTMMDADETATLAWIESQPDNIKENATAFLSFQALEQGDFEMAYNQAASAGRRRSEIHRALTAALFEESISDAVEFAAANRVGEIGLLLGTLELQDALQLDCDAARKIAV